MSALDEAVRELRAGRLVVMPTDTVYGIAARPDLTPAIRALFEVKHRPTEKALPILGSGLDPLSAVARFDERAHRVATAFWPGPLTLVLVRAEGFDHDLGGRDDGTVAVRVPASEVARALLEEAGPLAVTSANRSGRPPANSVDEARAEFGDAVAVYLDDGPGGGSPSTVVSLVGEPRVLREGAVSERDVLEAIER